MLKQLIRDTERNAGVVVHAIIYDLPEAMSTAYKKAIYHALQEGLTNGIRHGKSTEFHLVWSLSEQIYSLGSKIVGQEIVI